MKEKWNNMSSEERRNLIRKERTAFCQLFIDSIVNKGWNELDKNTKETLTIIYVASR
mgnify:CR=1 FL=1